MAESFFLIWDLKENLDLGANAARVSLSFSWSALMPCTYERQALDGRLVGGCTNLGVHTLVIGGRVRRRVLHLLLQFGNPGQTVVDSILPFPPNDRSAF